MRAPIDVDGADDVLGHVVAGRGLGGEDEDARHDVDAGILQDAPVEREDVQQVQVLALVLVQPLDLDVEDGVRRDLEPPHSARITRGEVDSCWRA